MNKNTHTDEGNITDRQPLMSQQSEPLASQQSEIVQIKVTCIEDAAEIYRDKLTQKEQ